MSAPATTPTPEPTDAAEVGETAVISRAAREYIQASCSLEPAEPPSTYGEAVDVMQTYRDFHENNDPPREIHDYIKANLALVRIALQFAEEQDRSRTFDPMPGWRNPQARKQPMLSMQSCRQQNRLTTPWPKHCLSTVRENRDTAAHKPHRPASQRVHVSVDAAGPTIT